MAETPSEAVPAPPPRRRKGGGAKFLFVLMIILALVGVIVYLLSLLNSKKFFLVPEGDQLVVKKGVFFVAGSEPYKGTGPQDAGLYAPIELPPKFGTNQREFDDLAALNIEFANILINEAQQLVFSTKDADYRLGIAYLYRLDRLKGLQPDQVKLIMALNADVDYLEAKRAYEGVEQTLEQALKKFRQAETYGTGRFSDAPEWIDKVEGLLRIIRATKAGVTPLPGTAAEPGSAPGAGGLKPEAEEAGPEPPLPAPRPRPKTSPGPAPQPAPAPNGHSSTPGI